MEQEQEFEEIEVKIRVPVKTVGGGALNLLLPKVIATTYNIEKGDIILYHILGVSRPG